MSQTPLIIFDDAQGQWGPLLDRRASFELRTGAATNWQRIERVLARRAAAIFSPPALHGITTERYQSPDLSVNALPPPVPAHDDFLLVNGAWSGLSGAAVIGTLAAGSAVAQADGRLIAARLSRAQAQALTATANTSRLPVPIATLPGRILLDRPWHVLEQLEPALRADAATTDLPLWETIASQGVVVVDGFPISVAPDARVHPMVVLNAEKGPIVIDHGAIVGSFCVVAGPCYIGPHSIVSPHTHLRANTAVGPSCVVAGEISHCVFHGHANKAHSGYLGNSLVGEWVNLGADTNASNLKNTYGTVRMQLEEGGDAQDSGQIKLGPVIGDFVRTAIGTRLLTGACVGTGSMLAVSGFAPKFVRRFSFCTDEGVERYDAEKFLDTTRKAMGRRGETLGAAEAERLRVLAHG